MNNSRFTYKEPNGTWGIKGISWEKIPHEMYGLLCKLKDYEETGLTPAQIEILKERQEVAK